MPKGITHDRGGRIRAKGATLATATAYAYTDPLKPDHAPSAVTTAGVTTTFTYDANGNMLTGLGAKIMTYDGENRPLSVTYLGKRTCYVYGVDGKRLKKVEGLPPIQDCTALPANTNATVYFGAVEVRNWLAAGAEQVLTYPHPAVKLLNGTTPAVATYLHRDRLSSVRAITNAAGVKIESALYKPFGEQSEWVLPGNAAPETKGWIGERFDADAGLQYLNARYYDPELSLFLQPDWFEVTKAGVGTNRFSYSFNDPVNKFDPGGNYAADPDDEDDREKRKKEREDAAKQVKVAQQTGGNTRNARAGSPTQETLNALTLNTLNRIDSMRAENGMPPVARVYNQGSPNFTLESLSAARLELQSLQVRINAANGRAAEITVEKMYSGFVVGNQIYAGTSSGLITRIDNVLNLNGARVANETKASPSARMSEGQNALMSDVINGRTVELYGRNARAAGFQNGGRYTFDGYMVTVPGCGWILAQ